MPPPVEQVTGPNSPIAAPPSGGPSTGAAIAAAAFGLTTDAADPHLGTEPLLDVIASSPALATFVGEQTRLSWPADYGLRRIPLRDPAPVYPHSLIWRSGNPHPALTTLRDYLGSTQPGHRDAGTWTPAWARQRAAKLSG